MKSLNTSFSFLIAGFIITACSSPQQQTPAPQTESSPPAMTIQPKESAGHKEEIKSVQVFRLQANEQTIELAWPAQKAPGLTRYQVFRKAINPVVTDEPREGQMIAELDQAYTSFSDMPPSPRARYLYYVRAVDQDGATLWQSGLRAGGLIDTRPPAVPSGFSASLSAEGDVILSWNRGRARDLTGYRIYRSTSADGALTRLQDRPVNKNQSQQYIDRIAYRDGRALRYAIAAIDASGNASARTAEIKIRSRDEIPPAAPILTRIEVQRGLIDLAWSPPPETDITSYRIYRAIGNEQDKFELIATIKATRFQDQQVEPGLIHLYRISALDGSGNESRHSTVRGERALAANQQHTTGIKKLTITASKQASPQLRWQAEPAKSLRGYLVYRQDAPGTAFMQVSPLLKTNTFTDKRITTDQRYRYKVRALLHQGRVTAFSNIVSWGQQP